MTEEHKKVAWLTLILGATVALFTGAAFILQAIGERAAHAKEVSTFMRDVREMSKRQNETLIALSGKMISTEQDRDALHREFEEYRAVSTQRFDRIESSILTLLKEHKKP